MQCASLSKWISVLVTFNSNLRYLLYLQYNSTPLGAAVRAGHIDMLYLLTSFGACFKDIRYSLPGHSVNQKIERHVNRILDEPWRFHQSDRISNVIPNVSILSMN